MPRVESKPVTPVVEGAKMFLALHRVAAAIGSHFRHTETFY
jgi:hypothetical protein